MVSVGGDSSLAAGTLATARVGVGSNGSWTTAGQLQVGGANAGSAGFAVINISNNGFVSGSTVAIHQTGVVVVGAGTSRGTLVAGPGGLIVDGGLFYNSGTINSVGTLSVGGSVLLSDAARNASGNPSNKKTLDVGRCTLSTAGVIDLNDNDMIIRGGQPLSQIEGFITAARNGGLWDGAGITSLAAKNHPAHATGLGVIRGEDFLDVYGAGATFNGRAVNSDDNPVKYTWNGDTDFNGKVDGADFSRIDASFNNQLLQGDISGWFNGDFDFNGKVDGTDYALIDGAFNSQSVTLRQTVPEPAWIGLPAAALLAFQRRARRAQS